MSGTLSNLYASYVRLYGNDMADDIRRTIGDAETIAKNTGDDIIGVAEDMLSDLLD